MCGNRDVMIEESINRFLDEDHERLIRKFALEADGQFLYIRVLNRFYQISRTDGIISERGSGRRPAHDIMMAVYDLFQYHADEESLPPLYGVWKNIADMEGIIGASHAKRLYNEAVIAPFTGKTEQLKEACLTLGGTEASDGDVSFILPVFEFFPVWFKYWDADDEFPADIRFLWDQNYDAFLHYEIIFYLTKYLEELLTEMIA